ncbi:MAG TPA: hypothetical protein VML75_02420, partial [Kofleriaceae bacterium]|nr:hypothetical protein [Kofleriaceae bacterium]
ATAATAAMALLVGGALWWHGQGGEAPAMAQPETGAPGALPTAPAPSEPIDRDVPLPSTSEIVVLDGFVLTPDTDADVRVTRALDGAGVEVRVERGKSRFRVANPATAGVAVHAGPMTIAVYARAFSVARYHDATEVWSHEGTLSLVWQGETITLPAGEHRRFEDQPAAVEPAPTPPRQRDRPVADWRPPARDGDHRQAYLLLRRAGGPGSSVADLMLAADVYRLSGHAGQAVAPLERVVAKHAGDPRAPLAAFSLGRVLLDELGRPGEAARAFAKARALAPRGALAEDALAREVEAWAKGGNASKARLRAELYLELYPVGHRQRAVEQYGGL